MAGLLVVYLNIQGAWLVAAGAGRRRTLLRLGRQLLGRFAKASPTAGSQLHRVARPLAQLARGARDEAARRTRSSARRKAASSLSRSRSSLLRPGIDDGRRASRPRPRLVFCRFFRRRTPQARPARRHSCLSARDPLQSREKNAIPITQRRSSIWERANLEPAPAAAATVPAAVAAASAPHSCGRTRCTATRRSPHAAKHSAPALSNSGSPEAPKLHDRSARGHRARPRTPERSPFTSAPTPRCAPSPSRPRT